ncbi:MAG: acyl-ACP--UDP-N-acetylglucosamine O-acyltransferase [Syntrophales bacterium]|nr:acyl-ACP--UDP-N-acetylglucosamine O-acyltransferase [Syntrophales bacterium]
MNIHPTAIISPEAQIAEDVEIGAYSIIGPDVHIGKQTVVGPHVVIESHTDIGERCRIYQFAAIGAAPQDLKFKGEKTRVIIGNDNTIREFVTIHRATAAYTGTTVMGDHNLIMAYSHIAHNCILDNHIIMVNAANLAGHIHVEDYAIIGGLTGVHQFTRIGAHSMIGGASAVTRDVAPYLIAAGNHATTHGLNVVGLKRRGFEEETINAIKRAYTLVFRSSLLLKTAIERIREEVEDIPEVRHFLEFIEKSERGLCR